MPDSFYAIAASFMRYVFLALIIYFLLRLLVLSLSEYAQMRRIRKSLVEETLHKLLFFAPEELEGDEYILRKETRVGRKKNSDLRLRYKGVRREHALIVNREQVCTVFPFGRKRVKLNGEYIRQKAELQSGDTLEFGTVICEYEVQNRGVKEGELSQNE